LLRARVRVMVFNTTFNNISVIPWRSILLVEETAVPGENHQPAATHQVGGFPRELWFPPPIKLTSTI
jgi:hypothetical protein